jgi:hypothetical protein
MSPIGFDNLLDNVDDWDRFQKDGFKINNNWILDPTTFGNGNNVGNLNLILIRTWMVLNPVAESKI